LFPVSTATRPRPYLGGAADGGPARVRDVGWPAVPGTKLVAPPAPPTAHRPVVANGGFNSALSDDGHFGGDTPGDDDSHDDSDDVSHDDSHDVGSDNDHGAPAVLAVGVESRVDIDRGHPPAGNGALDVSSSVDAVAGVLAVQDDLMARARVEIVELALHVARHVIGEHVAWGAFDLKPVIEDALRQLGEALEVVVRVGPQQHATVAAAIGNLAGAHRARVVLDESLGAGDVVIVSDSGTVDGRLEHRLSAIAHAVRTSVGGGDRP